MTAQPPRVSCILPAFNEGESVCPVIEKIRELHPDFEVILVDDGSSDNTAELAERSGARVIRHTYNIGNGAAVKTGIRNAKGSVIIMMDSDGQHPPEDIARLLEDIGPYDMVVGARSKNAQVSKFRSFGNWGLIRIAEFLTGAKIPDLTSGFRAIKKTKSCSTCICSPTSTPTPLPLRCACSKAATS